MAFWRAGNRAWGSAPARWMVLAGSLLAALACAGPKANPANDRGGADAASPDGTRTEAGVPQESDGGGQGQNDGGGASSTVCQDDGGCPPCGYGTFAEGGVCTPWTECVPGEHMVRQGTVNRDRECAACEEGTYSTDRNVPRCRVFDTCEPGEYINGKRVPTAPILCLPCVGKFSTEVNATECKKWTRCPRNYGEDVPATSKNDRTCKPMFESCEGLASECGPSHHESCCKSLRVPGGAYRRFNGRRSVSLSNFRLDAFEVTVGRFRNFAAAWDAGWRPLAGAGKHTHLGRGVLGLFLNRYESGWDPEWANQVDTTDEARSLGRTYATWTSEPGDNEQRPINYVNWYEAYAFCTWDGGFLPTETERNYAATGGSEQRKYPWSDPASDKTISAEYASYLDEADCTGDDTPGCSVTDIVDVGTKPAGNGRFGQADLAGNLWEWGLDTYARFDWPNRPCTDCGALYLSAPRRVRGGGGFLNAPSFLLNNKRYFVRPDNRGRAGGFRCAREP